MVNVVEISLIEDKGSSILCSQYKLLEWAMELAAKVFTK